MRFHVIIDGVSEGPFTRDEIEDLHGAGIVTRNTQCRAEGKTEWSNVYNQVPTAVWVTTWRNNPPALKQDSVPLKKITNSHRANSPAPIRQLETHDMVAIAGWVCVGIGLATFWMWSDAIKFVFPFLAVVCGLAVIILKKPTQGIGIVAAATLAMVANELYIRHQLNQLGKEATKAIEEMNKTTEDFKRQMQSIFPSK